MKDRMEQILKIRHESPAREIELCLELLKSASPDDWYTQAFARTYLADGYQTVGRLEEAIQESQAALEITKKNGYDQLTMVLYNLSGIIHVGLLDEQEALDYFFEGMEFAKKMEDSMMQAALLSNIGRIYAKAGAYDKARDSLQEAYEIARTSKKNEKNVRFSREQFLIQNAVLSLEKQDIDEALSYLNEVVADMKEPLQNKSIFDIDVQLLFACCYAKKGERALAVEYVESVLEEIEMQKNPYVRLDFYYSVIEFWITLEAYEEALAIAKKAESILQTMNNVGRWLKLSQYEVTIYQKLGQQDALREVYKVYCEDDMALTESRKKAKIKRLKKRIELQNERNRHANMEARQNALFSKNEYDELTGVWNRRGIRSHMEQAYEQAKEKKEPFALVLVDVDFFKEYNDTYGHVAGDESLKQVAMILKDAMQDKGMVGRYGGDEFLLAIHGMESSKVRQILDDIRKRLQACEILNTNSKVSEYLTLTMGGMNRIPDMSTDFLEHLRYADRVLYRVKEKSRDAFEIQDS